MDLLPFTAIAPTQKITIDCFPMRIVLGQSPPLTPGFNNIKNGIDHISDIYRARTPHFSLNHKIFEQLSLFIAQVTWIDFNSHTPLVVQFQ